MEAFAAFALETELTEAFGSAHHLVSEHLLVGDFPGLMKGSFDYFTNQA